MSSDISITNGRSLAMRQHNSQNFLPSDLDDIALWLRADQGITLSGLSIFTFDTTDFNSGLWTKTALTVNNNATTDPDGGSLADQIVEAAGVLSHSFIDNANRVLFGKAATITIYAKDVDIGWIYIHNQSSPTVWFNIADGYIGTESGGATGTITDVGNDWWRCTMSFTAVSVGVIIGLSREDNDMNYDVTAGEPKKSCYLYNISASQADFSRVSGWDDQSGLGRNLTQATVTKMPKYVSSGQNGRPYLEFDGFDDRIAGTWTQNQPVHLFVAGVPNRTLDASQDKTWMDSPSNGFRCYTQSTLPLNMICYSGLAVSGIMQLSPHTTNLCHAYEFKINGASSRLHAFDLNITAPQTTIGTTTLGGLTLGDYHPIAALASAVCDIYEVIQYSRILDSDEVANIKLYLQNKYAL